MVLRVRAAAFQAILRQPVGWFDASSDHTAGSLSARLSTDCYMVKALTGERAGLVVSQVAVLLSGLGIAFASSWRITLCLFALVPMFILPVVVQVCTHNVWMRMCMCMCIYIHVRMRV